MANKRIKQVKAILLTEAKYPDAVALINKVAVIQDRKPHDVASRILREACSNILNSKPKSQSA